MEEKLRQNHRTMQQMEAELQTFQKSCLLQLARSSWVGRVIRSQTGSVEVSLCPSLAQYLSGSLPPQKKKHNSLDSQHASLGLLACLRNLVSLGLFP